MNKKRGFDLKKIFEVNRLVRFFILSDLMFLGGWGLVGPIFAIFVVDDIKGTSLVTVGAVVGVYWLVKAFVQLPLAIHLDKRRGERDDFHALVFGLLLGSVASFSFILVESIPMLFLAVAVKAVAFGFYTPSWSAIFSRHLDKKRYAFDWSLDNATVGIALGATSFLGGAMAKFFGFDAVFALAGTLSFMAVVVLISVPHLVLPKPRGKNLSNNPMFG